MQVLVLVALIGTHIPTMAYTKYRPGNVFAAPELDAAVAPISILLIGSLMAIGLERRRKKASSEK